MAVRCRISRNYTALRGGFLDLGRWGLCVMAVAGCVHSPSLVHRQRPITYWQALAELHAADAVTAAGNVSEREFAEALQSLMDGDIEKAEQEFGKLRRSAADSTIRIGSRVIYTATLQYQEKWVDLAALKGEIATSPNDGADRASIEAWAAAFRSVPAKTLTFRGQSMVLPMSMSGVGTPLIPVKIAGKEYNFWLDTGSSMTMLASDLARDLGILPVVPETLEVVTATGRVPAQPSVIPELEIGRIMVKNAPTMIVDEQIMEMRESRARDFNPKLKIDGIIGFDIIRQLDVEVDYEESRVRVRNPASSRRDGNRNMFWVGLPVIRMMTTDGTTLHFGLDTGAQVTFVTETLLDKLQIQPGRVESRRVGGLGGEVSLRAPVLPDLRVLVRGFPILFRGAVVRAPVYQVLAALDGVLGGDVWNSGIVRIDMTNGIFSVRQSQSNRIF